MPPPEFRNEHTPIGYLITFRSYGTWLHGKKGSSDRSHTAYGTPKLAADDARFRYNRRALPRSPVKLNAPPRAPVHQAVRETCEFRTWSFWPVNARTNHAHTAPTPTSKPA